MAFGREIKRLRNVHHVSAQLLADAVGINLERYKAWEKKDLNPKAEDTRVIEKYFGIPINEFSKLEKLPKIPSMSDVKKREENSIEEHEPFYLTKKGKLTDIVEDLLNTKNDLIETQRDLIDSLKAQITQTQELREIKQSLGTISKVLSGPSEKGKVNFYPVEGEEEVSDKTGNNNYQRAQSNKDISADPGTGHK